ncbi:MAG: crossover junction endodeoxyribonuclease RuvC, partial [Thermodesulfovibrionia bacterium]|nr:crossover junction endodeoxyribonuclease RuvC [Thermodesulfovibrionia bacterium]
MRTLGIDPGTRVMGYGIVDGLGNSLKHVDNGGIFTDPAEPLNKRLKVIYDEICRIIEQYRP